MVDKSKIDVNFDNILGVKKHFTKFLSENVDGAYPNAFCIFAEALFKRDFSSQQELSDYLDVNKAHTSRTLFKMHSKGLVKLEPKRIYLTEKGKTFAKEAIENKQKFVESLFEGISDEEFEVFSRTVNQIIENTKKIQEE